MYRRREAPQLLGRNRVGPHVRPTTTPVFRLGKRRIAKYVSQEGVLDKGAFGGKTPSFLAKLSAPRWSVKRWA